MTKQPVKIRFEFTNSTGDSETEVLWAIPREDGYEIDNIPFYLAGLAVGDLVSAEPDSEGTLWRTGIVKASGHSTIQILFADQDDVQQVSEELINLGCSYEGSDNPELIAVDVPPDVLYERVKAYLDQGESDGTFEYREACLGFPGNMADRKDT